MYYEIAKRLNVYLLKFVRVILYNVNLNFYQPQESYIPSSRPWICWSIVRYLVQLFRWEVGSVGDGAEVWYKWRVDFTDGLPVNAIEEIMIFDLLHSEPFISGYYKPGANNTQSLGMSEGKRRQTSE